MNKINYMKELDRRLKYLPKEDKEDAIAYYKEYLDEMEIADTDEVPDTVESPKAVAAEIIKNCTEKAVEQQKESKSVKGSGKIVWLVILGIASIPVSVPLAAAAVAVAIALLAALFAVIVSLFAAALGIFCAGLFAVGSVFVVPGFSNKLATFAVGALATGVGIFAVMGMLALTKWVVGLIGNGFVGLKKRKGEKDYE